MLLSRDAHGVYAIAPTPFEPNGSIDWPSVDRLIDFYAAVGVDGITVLGQMGEAPKLTHDESVAIAERVIKQAGVPVVVGVSAAGFAAMAALSDQVMSLGAAGVLIAPPNVLRTDDQIVGYYRDASDAVGSQTPFAIQDYPLSFSVVMTVDVIARISSENPNCVMVKHEDWPGLEKISGLRAAEAAGRTEHLSILCGNGGLFLDFETERGADGAMTGYCFPEMLVDVVAAITAGRRDQAHDLFDAHLPLVRYEQQMGVGLAVRKYVFTRRGIIASDHQRRPGGRLTDRARAEVDYLLDRLARHDLR
jgi:4-hydroxy-tetrahydrodipicolinate synthase